MRIRLSLLALAALLTALPATAQRLPHADWATDPQTGEPVAFSADAPPAYDRDAQRAGGGDLVLLDHWAEGSTKVARTDGDLVFYQNGALLVSARLEGDPLGLTPLDTLALAGQPGDVALYQGYAYVGLRKGRGLSVIDVSDPAAMQEVSRVEDGREGISVAAADGALYLGMGTAGVAVYDLASPEAPAFVRSFSTPGSANGFAIADDLLHVADGNEGARIYDLDSALDPTFLGAIAADGFVTNVAVRGDVAYLTGGFGLISVDITDPASPSALGANELGGSSAYELAFADDPGVAYVASLTGVYEVNISDPSASLLPLLGLNDDGQQELGVAASGGAVFVSDRFRGLRVLEAATLDQAALARNGGFSARGTFAGDRLYVTDLAGALRIFDVSGSTMGDASARLLSVTDVPPNTQEVEVRGDRAYVTDSDFGGTGLTILDVSDPAAPSTLAAVGFGNQAFGLDVVGTTVYLCNGFSGLVVLDAADLQNVVELGSFAFGANANDVVVDAENEIAYVVSFGGGMRSLDVSDPANIVELDAEAWGFLNAVAFQQDTEGEDIPGELVVADGQQGLRLVDASTPAALTTTSTLPALSQARDVLGPHDFFGDFGAPAAYVASDFYGIQRYRLAPDGPVLNDTFESADRGFGVAFQTAAFRSALMSGETGVYLFTGFTGLSSPNSADAARLWLGGARPNPTASASLIEFSLLHAGSARLEAFDVLGRRVAVLHDGPLPAGEHERTFDASSLPAGVYVLRLQTETAVATTRVTVVR